MIQRRRNHDTVSGAAASGLHPGQVFQEEPGGPGAGAACSAAAEKAERTRRSFYAGLCRRPPAQAQAARAWGSPLREEPPVDESTGIEAEPGERGASESTSRFPSRAHDTRSGPSRTASFRRGGSRAREQRRRITAAARDRLSGCARRVGSDRKSPYAAAAPNPIARRNRASPKDRAEDEGTVHDQRPVALPPRSGTAFRPEVDQEGGPRASAESPRAHQ